MRILSGDFAPGAKVSIGLLALAAWGVLGVVVSIGLLALLAWGVLGVVAFFFLGPDLAFGAGFSDAEIALVYQNESGKRT